MTDDEIPDPLIKMKADVDQMQAMAPEIARVARAWFDVFIAEGFSEAQALYLTATELLQNPGEAP